MLLVCIFTDIIFNKDLIIMVDLGGFNLQLHLLSLKVVPNISNESLTSKALK